jgi:hypothetical protein
MFYLYDVVVGKNIKLWTEPLNGEFQHNGDPMGQFNRRDIDLRKRKHNNKYNIWRGSANNTYIHEEGFLTKWMRKNTCKWLNSQSKIMNKRGLEAPILFSFLSFFFLPCVSLFFPSLFPFICFFSLHGPKWACSQRTEWAYGYIGPASIFLTLQMYHKLYYKNHYTLTFRYEIVI